MATIQFVQAKKTTLNVGISAAETSEIVLKKLVDIYDNDIAFASFGTIMYLTIDPGSATEEIISATGFTRNADDTVSLNAGITRGLAAVSPYASGGTASAHAAGVRVVVSNNPQIYASLVSLTGDQTVAGVKTFSSSPIVPAPTTDLQAATKKYADDLAIAGAPDASTTVKGIIEIATQAEADARTAAGGTGAVLVPTPALNRTVLTHDYIASAVGTDAYAITCVPAVTAYTAGDVYYFKADVANTGACTLNVNALGAKTLLVNTTLTPPDGYIKAGSLVQCQYDGTNMQILSVAGTAQLSQSFKEVYGASSAGTDTYAITVAPVPIAYAAGQVFIFKADVANTGAATLNVNGLGALTILRPDGTGLSTGDITANQIVAVAVYDGTNCKMLSALAGGINTGKAAGSGSLTISQAVASDTDTNTVGFRPRMVIVNLRIASSGASVEAVTVGFLQTIDGGTNFMGIKLGGDSANSEPTDAILHNLTSLVTSSGISIDTAGANSIDGTVTIGNFTSTGFDVVFTRTDTGGTASAVASYNYVAIQ